MSPVVEQCSFFAPERDHIGAGICTGTPEFIPSLFYSFCYTFFIDVVQSHQDVDRDMKRQIHKEQMRALKLVTSQERLKANQERLKIELLQEQIRNEKAGRVSRWNK